MTQKMLIRRKTKQPTNQPVWIAKTLKRVAPFASVIGSG